MTPDELMRMAHLKDDVERLTRELAGADALMAEDQRLFEQVEEEFLADTRRLDGRVNALTDALKAVLSLFGDDSEGWPRIDAGTNGYGTIWGKTTSEDAAVVWAARRTLAETEQGNV